MPNTERRSQIGTDSGGGHRAANRVVDILELLAASADGLALRDLSGQLETPKSSLLPLLRALTVRGYLTQGRAGEYRLGPGVLDLGAAVPTHRKLVDIARPVVVDLGRRTGETVFVGVLGSDRTSVVYVDKVESDHVIRYAGGVGDRRPLHATSSGKAILAFLSREEREEILRSLSLARHTARTLDEPARASGLARRDPAVGCLGDGRRVDAGGVRHRRGDLRPSRAGRRRLRDRRAHGPGPPEAPVARRRGHGRRACGLGEPRASTGGTLGIDGGFTGQWRANAPGRGGLIPRAMDRMGEITNA